MTDPRRTAPAPPTEDRASPARRTVAPRVCAFVALVLALGACAVDGADDGGTGNGAAGNGADDGAADDSAADDDGRFTILAVGDVLPHDNVIESAELDDGRYDFQPLMAGVQGWISGADLALCNLEVPLTPEGTEPSGFPMFGAPEELIRDLDAVGFHGCGTANNHSMDRELEGLRYTLDVMDEHGMGHAGTARSEQEALQPQRYTLERGGQEIVIAHLSTTLLHNAISHPVPEDQPWSVTDVEADELSDMAAQARDEGADIVVASVHWGEEYVHEPGSDQVEYAERLASRGEIDAVFGAHSHTPQPVESLDGGPDGDGMWVAWSMGNFLSNQDEQCCAPETGTGAMVLAEVAAAPQEDPRVTGLEWAPVTVDRSLEGHRGIWSLDELLNDGIPDGLELDLETAEERHGRIVEVMGEESHRTEVPEPTGPAPEVEPREQ